ncbi:hypothetical protein GGR95_000466 [Sulfitobacter undariae]|uniref:Uncharacterized protein n=1 Tax=Sulfitobacter undariae TaxID=1563671 RepID=A0A7W6E558_9RHOB|nr:hypothetical protein [Sulfitobacter undariae]MBB3992847.1 hypothetical protein [Sulfitobacter undariae]
MVYTKQDFVSRVKNVDGKHARLVSRGYTSRVDKNGIIVVKPKGKRLRFPIKGLLLLVLCFLGFKALVLTTSGPATYNERLAVLENGTAFEVLGATVLSIDPATQFIADQATLLLR